MSLQRPLLIFIIFIRAWILIAYWSCYLLKQEWSYRLMNNKDCQRLSVPYLLLKWYSHPNSNKGFQWQSAAFSASTSRSQSSVASQKTSWIHSVLQRMLHYKRCYGSLCNRPHPGLNCVALWSGSCLPVCHIPSKHCPQRALMAIMWSWAKKSKQTSTVRSERTVCTVNPDWFAPTIHKSITCPSKVCSCC